MTDTLQPYSDYKETGLPWLGSIPTHWDLKPNRGIIRRRKVLVGKNHSNFQLLSLTKAGVIVRDVASGKGKFSSDMGTSQEVRKGDLIFCLFDVPETPRTVGLSSHDGMITGAYTVFHCLDPKESHYFELFYRVMDDRKLLSPLYSGLRHTIPNERFRGTKTPLPPPAEQAAIVRYLDHANSLIERAIRAKRKIIALLTEQKQAIIHCAVTRGLNHDVALKPSGVPWLGDIPEHWVSMRIKYLLRDVDNRSTTGLEPLLSMRMHHGLVVFSEHFTRPPQAETLVGFKIVRPRQFVVNRMQAGNGVIFPSRLSITGLVSPDYAVFDPIADVNVDYLGELFRSRTLRVKFRSESKGLGTGTSGFMRLYNDRFGAIHIPLPPRDEQDSILKGIEVQSAALTAAINRAEREIALLREYRTRLTADIVTGKLDVREAAASLPDLGESGTPDTSLPSDLSDSSDLEPELEEVEA